MLEQPKSHVKINDPKVHRGFADFFAEKPKRGNKKMEAADYRSFCDVLEEQEEVGAPALPTASARTETHSPLEHLRLGLVGRLASFTTPYGERPIVYADWTASGRAHVDVESYVSSEVLPFYGNTHTTTSITGCQSTCFRHEARQVVAEAVNAKVRCWGKPSLGIGGVRGSARRSAECTPEGGRHPPPLTCAGNGAQVTGRAAEDVVLFTGSGATAAVNKLVQILGLHLPASSLGDEGRPVVLVGPMEHHSNLIPWRESSATVVQLPPGPDGETVQQPCCLGIQTRNFFF